MKNNVTLFDVAKEAKVSLATASRVINNKGIVTNKTKEKVARAIKKLNYVPNIAAQQLATSKTTNIAIIIPEMNYSYVSQILSGLLESAKTYNYDASIYSVSDSKEDLEQTIFKAVAKHPNGIIVFHNSISLDSLENIEKFNVPIVTLGFKIDGVSSVTFHYKDEITSLAINALKKNEQIYFLRPANSGIICQRVINGITRAYESIGKKFDNIIDIPDSYSETYKIFKKTISTYPKALFVSVRDSISLAVMNAACDCNFKIPDDYEFLAVIGTKYSELSRPRLSSFSINMKSLAIEGMKLLNDIIENGNKIHHLELTFDFTQRESTKL